MNNCNDDFYNYVNNDWITNTNIPNDKNSYNTFHILRDDTNNKIKQLIETSILSDNINYKKIGILYNQGLKLDNNYKGDFDKINKILKKIDKSKTVLELFNTILIYNLRFGITSPYVFYPSADYTDSTMNILYLSTSGLGLPDREYYEKGEMKDEYIAFLKEYSKLFDLNINIENFYNLEKTLAEKTFKKQDQRDIMKIHNTIHFNDFIAKYPQFYFIINIFKVANTKPGKININNLDYFTLLNNLIIDDNLELWKEYFKLKFILDIYEYLSEKIYTCYFNFYGKKIKGLKDAEPIWKRSIKTCESLLGDLIGNMYVNKFFDESSKKCAEDLITFIKDEFKTALTNNWMHSSTKEKALAKLDKMVFKIGYPDKIDKDYTNMNISETKSYLDNILWANIFINEYNQSFLYKPVDRTLWFMNAHEINAYYAPHVNEIVFPAGILQSPIFSKDQDPAHNFGGIGTIISHEITHGFDDQGCKFDETGNLSNWWTNDDQTYYKELTNNIVEQFSQYEIDGYTVNGKLTLGENIADIGGVQISYNAYMKYLKTYPEYDRIIDELTPSQRFFINYAKIWKNKSYVENTKLRILTDPHSPCIFRVNGVLRNIDGFYKAFNISKTDKMYLDEAKRSKIWNK